MNEKLKYARLRMGWSQEEAAEAAQASVRAYQGWEAGAHTPTFESRRLLRSAFGATDEELGFGLSDSPRKQLVTLTHEELAAFTELLRAGGDMTLFDPAKRKTLATLATVLGLAATASQILGDPEPWERLFMAQQASSPSIILNPATLEHFEHLLATSWLLCNENQLATAERVLVSFLPQLLSLPRHGLGTASLASRGLRLQSIFAHHHSRLSDKVRICEQSVNYAREAEDANILVTALIELAWAYKYAGLPDSLQKRLIILREALDQSPQASPLVQARSYSEYSLVLAERKRIREAELYIELAQEVFPDDPTKDLAFAFADSNMFDISYCAAFVYIHAGSITQEFAAFERYKQHPSGLIIPERYRLIIANGQSQAAILANDAERYADLLEDVILGSARIGSQKRFDEALAIFRQEMPRSWLLSSRIKQLSEQYGLKREEKRVKPHSVVYIEFC